MARERKVTRTIKSTVAVLKVVNLKAEAIESLGYEFAGTFKDAKALEKHIEKKNLLPDYKLLSVVSMDVNETLYGMPEQMFMELAEKIDATDEPADAE